MRKHVVLDRFNGKPLEVTVMRGDKERVYTGRQAQKVARHFALHKKQTFIVIPNAR